MPRIEPLSYYKWFWKDWRANRAVQRMHYIARGFYRELLDEQFAEGFIPDDIGMLAEICGCPQAVMKEYWPEIQPHFTDHTEGGLVHPKMESVRTELDASRVKNSRAARTPKKGQSGGAQQSFPDFDGASTVHVHRQPEEKRRVEVEESREEKAARASASKTPPEPQTKPPKVFVPNVLHPMESAEMDQMVRRIAVAHPRNLMRHMQWGEVVTAHILAILKAMKDEMAVSGCSPMACLELILDRVEMHAHDIPPDRYQFVKDVPRYFEMHEYRLESSYFNREDKPNGRNISKGDATMAALRRSIETRRDKTIAGAAGG
jgi:hypothetical protein